MFGLLLLAAGLEPAGAAAPAGQHDAAADAARADDSAKETGTKGRNGWTALKAAIAKRLAADRARLKDLLDRNYLSDLGLDYADKDNRAYLERKIGELAKADPDLGGILLEYLDPGGAGGALQHRADNARRILERMDLTPYRRRLRKILEGASLSGRLRALLLLTKVREPGLTAVLQRFLQESPEIFLPVVLRCVGRYRDPTLAPSVVPLLRRPSPEQRLAALRALAELRAVDAIEPATTAVRELDSEQAYRALLDLLRRVAEKLPEAGYDAYLDALLQILAKSGGLGKLDILEAVRLVAGLPAESIAARFEKIEPALVELVEHRYPEVQYAAANLLDRQGNRIGVKRVLDRLNDFVKRNRRVPYAYYQRARAYAAFGKVTEALRDVNQAIRYSAGPEPTFHFFAAGLEVVRGNANQVAKHLKSADPTPQELQKFRSRHPAIEPLIAKNRTLRRLFEQ